jgi:hypothetical protein
MGRTWRPGAPLVPGSAKTGLDHGRSRGGVSLDPHSAPSPPDLDSGRPVRLGLQNFCVPHSQGCLHACRGELLPPRNHTTSGGAPRSVAISARSTSRDTIANPPRDA